ncbi:MAG: JAB domain-containing protein [Bacteroidota bacterium]
MNNPNFEILRQVAEGAGVAELRIILTTYTEGRPILESSGDIAKYARNHVFNKDRLDMQEEVFVLLLDMNQQLIAPYQISIGTIDQGPVPFAPIIRAAACANASRVVLVHNHPQGSAQPSEADIDLAIALSHALRLADFQFDDSIVITPDSHSSLVELRLLLA